MHIVHHLDKRFDGKGDMVAVASFLFNDNGEFNPLFDMVHPDDACNEDECPPIAASDLELNFEDADLGYDRFY